MQSSREVNDDSQIQMVNNGHGFGSDFAAGTRMRPGNKPTDPYGHANSSASDGHTKVTYADACPTNAHA
jgi:hypothetical protein